MHLTKNELFCYSQNMNKTTKEIFRFLIVGALATIVDLLAMSLFIYSTQSAKFESFLDVFLHGKAIASSWAVIVGSAVGFLFGLIVNYLLSCCFVFENTKFARTKRGFCVFAALSAIGLGIHATGMYLGYTILGINEWIVKIVLTLVVLVFNYITRKKIIFKEHKNNEKC